MYSIQSVLEIVSSKTVSFIRSSAPLKSPSYTGNWSDREAPAHTHNGCPTETSASDVGSGTLIFPLATPVLPLDFPFSINVWLPRLQISQAQSRCVSCAILPVFLPCIPLGAFGMLALKYNSCALLKHRLPSREKSSMEQGQRTHVLVPVHTQSELNDLGPAT